MIHVKTTDAKAVLLLVMASALLFSAALTCASQQVFASEESKTLRALNRMPTHHTDVGEPTEKRQKRMAAIAEAIDAASQLTRDRAALLTILRYESNAARYVHHSKCSEGPRGPLECDSGKATGLWQIHGDVPDDLEGQAVLAIRIWRFGLTRCSRAHPDSFAGAFQSFGSGGKCAPSASSTMRANYMRQIVRDL